jgi:tripartite-type tricarboxylate transporter receptor subunit TctC
MSFGDNRAFNKWSCAVAHGLAAVAWAAYLPVQAQGFPTQRVTLVVPLQPGGAIDVLTRTISPLLEEKWKQPVVVENRPGGNLMIGTSHVAKAPPNGYTLLLNGNAFATTQLFVKSMDYSADDLTPVIEMVRGANFVVINSEIPAKTLQEFIAYAKTRPRALNYGTVAQTTFDLDYANFSQKAGVEMTGVAYTGTPIMVSALARNEIQFLIMVPALAAPMISAGKITLLASTGPQRLQQHPNVPTVRELGVDFETTYSIGMLAPARTPEAVVSQIGRDVGEALKAPAVGARAKDFGFEVTALPGPDWNALLKREVATYTAIAQRVGITPQ